jgi:membrane-bound serine protease (ClpP class)
MLLSTLAVCGGALWGQSTDSAQPAQPRAQADPTSTPSPARRERWPEAPAGARFTEDGWFAPPARSAPLPEVPDPVERAYVIAIEGPIDTGAYDRLKRKVFIARSRGAQLVVLEMDTPGGRVDVMLDIANLLDEALGRVRTVAFVTHEAISAGAFISMACDEIYMRPGTTIGDAMPVMMAPGGGVQPMPPAEREKIESYLRGKIRGLAEKNGYSEDLAEALVTLKVEVWLIRNVKTGQLKYFQPTEVIDSESAGFGEARDEASSAVQTSLVPEGWQFVKRVDRSDRLLTMTAREAVELGFCKQIVTDRAALGEIFDVQGEMIFMKDTTEERIAAFLTAPAITGLLVLIGIGAIYLEFNTPGLGVPAAIALAAFTILIGSHFMLGLALWWEVLLFALGIILIGLEIFVIPGFGVAGISGILLCGVSLLAMMIPNAEWEFPWPRSDLMWGYFKGGAISLTIGFVGSVTLAILLARFLPKSPLANKIFLGPAQGFKDPPSNEQHPIRRVQPGQTGLAASTCRPVGQVRIDGQLLDAVAEGRMIQRGSKIRVLRNDGNRLLVEEADEE